MSCLTLSFLCCPFLFVLPNFTFPLNLILLFCLVCPVHVNIKWLLLTVYYSLTIPILCPKQMWTELHLFFLDCPSVKFVLSTVRVAITISIFFCSCYVSTIMAVCPFLSTLSSLCCQVLARLSSPVYYFLNRLSHIVAMVLFPGCPVVPVPFIMFSCGCPLHVSNYDMATFINALAQVFLS